eukprot:906376_1
MSAPVKQRSKPNLMQMSSQLQLLDIPIHENAELAPSPRTPLSPEYNEMNHNILWEGEIFENVQSLRHFRDSKSFVDHVLKTSHLSAIHQHFRNQILNYSVPTANVVASQSFGNNYNRIRQNRAKMNLVNSPEDIEDDFRDSDEDEEKKTNPNFVQYALPKRASFPKILNYDYRSVMDEFIKTYFFTPGFELLAGETPSDWKEHPESPLFTQILVPKDDDDVNTEFLMYFAQELNCLWKKLYREVNKNVSEHPYRYSFIPLRHPGIFVPGGRFREIYYWDTFWIIQGLLCCGMIESSIKLVENLADLVDRFGFVPNGTRKYYLTRSQPPMLILMANEVYNASKDIEWIQSILPSLVKEYEFWTKPPMQVSIVSAKKKQHHFSRYFTKMATPRPESYYEDRMTAMLANGNVEIEKELYRNIRTAAASGWDFSSRWCFDKNGAFGSKEIVPRKTSFHLIRDSPDMLLRMMSLTGASNLHDIAEDAATSTVDQVFDEFAHNRMQFTGDFSMLKTDIVNVVPVDLNVFVCKAERCLSRFYHDIGDKEHADQFKANEVRRMESISCVLWDNYHHQFRDWNFRYKCFGNLNVASNFSPLWLQCEDKTLKAKQKLLLESLSNSNLVCGGGIVCSLFETGEQWDYPNCWAPVNHVIIEGLFYMGEKEYALKLANIWINNNYHTYLATKKMHEKYHCDRYGTGGGGEYKPQFGFGWTNGVCLRLMQLFGPSLTLNQN